MTGWTWRDANPQQRRALGCLTSGARWSRKDQAHAIRSGPRSQREHLETTVKGGPLDST